MTRPPENSFHPLSRAEWRAWLAENYSRTEGVWLLTYKKATGKPRVLPADSNQRANQWCGGPSST